MRKYYIFITLLCLLSVGLATAVIILTGTPAKQKALQLDETRLSDFSSISAEINNFYYVNDKLPNSLNQLKIDAHYIRTTDPETGGSYTYKTTSSNAYELCATFSTDSKDDNRGTTSDMSYPYKINRGHKKGYDCIDYSVSDSNKGIFEPMPMPDVNAEPQDVMTN